MVKTYRRLPESRNHLYVRGARLQPMALTAEPVLNPLAKLFVPQTIETVAIERRCHGNRGNVEEP